GRITAEVRPLSFLLRNCLPYAAGQNQEVMFEPMARHHSPALDRGTPCRAARRAAPQASAQLARESPISRASFVGKKSPTSRFEDKACQSPRGECPGVNIDSGWQDFRLSRRRVAMHYDLTEARFAVQKFTANPQQIFGPLLFEGDTGADPGMA